MTSTIESPKVFAVLMPLLDRILDYDVPRKVGIDGEGSICINGIAIGDCSLARNFEITDDFLLRFDYGEGKKRFVYFGVRGFERVNRVKKILEFDKGSEKPTRTIWTET